MLLGRQRKVMLTIGLLFAYFFFGLMSHLLISFHQSLPLLMLEVGIAISLVVLLGFRFLPFAVLAKWCLLLLVTNGQLNWLTALWLAIIFNMQTALGAWLVSRKSGWPNDLTSSLAIVKLVIVAGPIAALLPVISAAIWVNFDGTLEVIGLYDDELFNGFSILWGALSLGGMIGTPLCLVVCSHSSAFDTKRKLRVMLPVGLMLSIALSSFYFLDKNEYSLKQELFANQMTKYQQLFAQQVNILVTDLEMLAAFYANSQTMESAEFSDFASRILTHLGATKFVAWAPNISLFQGSPLYQDVQLVAAVNQELDQPHWRSQPAEQLTYPIAFIEPKANFGGLISVNLTGHHNWRKALRYAIDNQTVVMSDLGAITVFENDSAVLLLLPVIDKQNQDIHGFMVSAVDIVRLHNNLFATTDFGAMHVKLTKVDSDQSVVLFDDTHTANHKIPHRFNGDAELQLLSQRLTLQFSAEDVGLELAQNIDAHVIGILGCVFTLLFMYAALVLTGRHVVFKQLIDQKTQDLVSEQARFMDMVDTADGIVWEADASTFQFTFVSKQAERLLGYSIDEWKVPGFWVTHLHPDDKEWAPNYCASCTQTAEAHDFEYRIMAKDGRIVWLHDIVTVVLEQGKPRWLRGIMVDITASKEIQQELLESRQRTQTALDAANAGTFTFDLTKKEFIWDKRANDIFGADISVNSWTARLHPEDQTLILDNIAASLSNVATETFSDSFRILDENNDIRYIAVKAQIERDGQGNAVKVHGLYQDISEMKRVEDEKTELNRQLLQAQKMEAIGQLTGGIAHDFNNILASILGFTSLSLERHVAPEQVELKDYLTEVYQAGEKAKDLVGQLLLFSRGDDSGVLESLNIVPIIKEIIKLLQATLPSSVEISSEVMSKLPLVKVQPVHINQLLMNLTINAAQAMQGRGKLSIKVSHISIDKNTMHSSALCTSCQQVIPEQEYVVLSVRDSGPGIGKHILANIFEPFFTTKKVGEGTGMGLAMVHGIVHQLGGHLSVETQEGEGSCFNLLLPVSHEQPTIVTIESERPIELAEKYQQAHIVVVDDELAVCKFLSHLLELQGFSVTFFNESHAALTHIFAHQQEIDLVITDQTMPGLTGSDLVCAIRDKNTLMPIIICTGYSDYLDEERALAIGANAFLEKPIEIPKLLLAIEHCFVDNKATN